MDRNELMGILPHRGNMLLLDEAEISSGKAHAKYCVRGDEFFLDGHFPGNPIVPGVILCEMLAQSTCVLFSDALTDGKTPVYTGLKNVHFTRPVHPGETVEFYSEITRHKANFYFAEGAGFVNGEQCIKGEFSFAILPQANA